MIITLETMAQLDWPESDGLLPAIVQDQTSGRVLMQAWMNSDALQATLDSTEVTFFSRSKARLWKKGETSGNVLDLVSIQADCDGDSLLVLVRPRGPACHQGTTSCWGPEIDPDLVFLSELEAVIAGRQSADPDSSYTARLFQRGIKYVSQKVGEEGVETALAASAGDARETAEESADLIYHLLVLLHQKGLSFTDVVNVLQTRHGK